MLAASRLSSQSDATANRGYIVTYFFVSSYSPMSPTQDIVLQSDDVDFFNTYILGIML